MPYSVRRSSSSRILCTAAINVNVRHLCENIRGGMHKTTPVTIQRRTCLVRVMMCEDTIHNMCKYCHRGVAWHIVTEEWRSSIRCTVRSHFRRSDRSCSLLKDYFPVLFTSMSHRGCSSPMLQAPSYPLEVKARPIGAATGDVWSRAITGGHTMTISLDVVCMRIGNTERHPGTACTCVLSRPLERELCMGNGVLRGGYLA